MPFRTLIHITQHLQNITQQLHTHNSSHAAFNTITHITQHLYIHQQSALSHTSLNTHNLNHNMVVVVVAFARIWGECSTIHSLPALYLLLFKVEISTYTLIPFFRPESVHSGLVSWHDCGQVFPDELHVSLFPDRFPHYAWTAAVIPLQLCWIKGVFVFSACHLHFCRNDWGLLCATAVTQG